MKHFYIKLFLALTLFGIQGQLFATTHTITVQNFSFNPSSLTANLGDTIVWQWSSGSHTTTSMTIPGSAASWDANLNSSSTSFTYVPSVVGSYSYKCTPHFASGMSGTFTISGGSGITPGAKPQGTHSVKFYPQPFLSILNLDLSLSQFSKGFFTVEIYDLLGQNKFKQFFEDIDEGKIAIDLAGIAPGVYFISVIANGVKETYKISKSK